METVNWSSAQTREESSTGDTVRPGTTEVCGGERGQRAGLQELGFPQEDGHSWVSPGLLAAGEERRARDPERDAADVR